MAITIHPNEPVLIAGPTASGKSALALHIATRQGGVVINADALQVFACWRALSARPDAQEMAMAPHHLYGHIGFEDDYSVGQWLREVAPLLRGARPIIVGGTGLYLSALTEGLAEIPPTPADIRAHADTLSLADLRAGLDPLTAGRIDLQNRARVQRAFEVQKATGQSLATWQNNTPAPLLALDDCVPIVLEAPKDWLTPRIAARFDKMLEDGALDEARAVLPDWNPQRPAAKAIGAPELIAHLNGEMTLEEARDAAIIGTRQYAKRQRTWFRKRMRDWHSFAISSTDLSTGIILTT